MSIEITHTFYKKEDVEKLFSESINDLKIPDLERLPGIERTIYTGNKKDCSFDCNYLQEHVNDEEYYFCIESNVKIRLRSNPISHKYPCERSENCKKIYGDE